MNLLEQMHILADADYRLFQIRLMPSVDAGRVLGVRTPDLRDLAKKQKNSPQKTDFLLDLPHIFYEENNLHGLFINEMTDFDQVIAALDAFLPYVDNWATCDLLRPKPFAKHKKELLPHLFRWMDSTHPYTVRFGIEMLMVHYLEDSFDRDHLLRAADCALSEHYYVKMMVAWYFATALAKQYDAAVAVLQKGSVEKWTHNKAIQKALESYRIPDSRKEYLKTLKR
ncbi:MAG: DNA alkylation repair protein [Oscillospiraceae bacterium]|nr:DNA alkylation repair protein [Oscillospiraceae bacterium]